MERDREVNVINKFLEENFLNKNMLFFEQGKYESNESMWPIPKVLSIKAIRLNSENKIEIDWLHPEVEEPITFTYDSLFKLVKHYCKYNSDTFNYTGF